MARCKMTLPDATIKNIEKLAASSENVLGEALKAGAKTVVANVKKNINFSRSANAKMLQGLRVSVPYFTPTDRGLNIKIYFSGYMTFSGNRTEFSRGGYVTKKGVPRPFVAQVREFGKHARMPSRPFFRKSFNGSQIRNAMLKARREALQREGVKFE